MGEIVRLDPPEQRMYGYRRQGFIEINGEAIPLTVRSRRETGSPDDHRIVIAPGWGGGKNSVRALAQASLDADYDAVTLGYASTEPFASEPGPIRHNAETIARVIDAVHPDAVMGHSMGGAALAIALNDLSAETARITDATFIAPAIVGTWNKGIAEFSKQLWLQGIDTIQASLRRPLQSYALAVSSLTTIARRPAAFQAEALGLIFDSRAKEAYETLAARNSRPHMALVYGRNDHLIPKDLLDQEPCDVRLVHDGDHLSTVYDNRQLTDAILAIHSGSGTPPLAA